MTIDEMREHEWSVSWSGGKDSTATIILMHEHQIPIKEILYLKMMYDDDLPATLPVMVEFVDKAKSVFESWGHPVRIIYPAVTCKDLIHKRYTRSKCTEKNGHCYGITAFGRGFCAFSKVKQTTLAALSGGPDEYQMIGYAADEGPRLSYLCEHRQSIMVTLGVKEKEAFDICRKYGLLSPLYDLGIKRDGCWFCPNCAKREREYLKETRPDLVEKIYAMIDMCDYDISIFLRSGRNVWAAEYKKDRAINEGKVHSFNGEMGGRPRTADGPLLPEDHIL